MGDDSRCYYALRHVDKRITDMDVRICQVSRLKNRGILIIYYLFIFLIIHLSFYFILFSHIRIVVFLLKNDDLARTACKAAVA